VVAIVPRAPGLIWVLGLVAGDVMVDGSIRGGRLRPLGLWWTAARGRESRRLRERAGRLGVIWESWAWRNTIGTGSGDGLEGRRGRVRAACGSSAARVCGRWSATPWYAGARALLLQGKSRRTAGALQALPRTTSRSAGRDSFLPAKAALRVRTVGASLTTRIRPPTKTDSRQVVRRVEPRACSPARA
jgi:hypothetical protein